MKYLRLSSIAILSAGLALTAGPSDAAKSGANPGADRSAPEASRPYVPPVLRAPEPSDSVVVRLPGPALRLAPQPPAPKEVAKAEVHYSAGTSTLGSPAGPRAAGSAPHASSRLSS